MWAWWINRGWVILWSTQQRTSHAYTHIHTIETSMARVQFVSSLQTFLLHFSVRVLVVSAISMYVWPTIYCAHDLYTSPSRNKYGEHIVYEPIACIAYNTYYCYCVCCIHWTFADLYTPYRVANVQAATDSHGTYKRFRFFYSVISGVCSVCYWRPTTLQPTSSTNMRCVWCDMFDAHVNGLLWWHGDSK